MTSRRADGWAARFVRDVARHPSTQVAILTPSSQCTYGQLLAESRRAQVSLEAAGVRAGSRVLMRAHQNTATIAVLLACLSLGATMVPVSATASEREFEEILEDCRPTITVQTTPDGSEPFELLSVSQTGGPDTVGVPLIIYTSGSTAAPKGVVCPEDAIAFALDAISGILRYRPEDRVLLRLPLHFDYGLYQVLLTLEAGGTLALFSAADDARLGILLHRAAVTVIPIVPSLAAVLLLSLKRIGPVETVRLITNTGEALTPERCYELANWFPYAEVRLMYGLTECKRIAIGEANEYRTHPGAVGRALPGTTIEILGEDGRTLGSDAVGEIAVAGEHLMAGYWNRDDETRARFVTVAGTTFLLTGDYGSLDSEGRLTVHGRKDMQFKVKGTRVSALEIERAAMTIPDVLAAAVARNRKDGSPTLFVVAPGLEIQDLHSRMRSAIDVMKIPASICLTDALPLTSAGKIDKRRLEASLNA